MPIHDIIETKFKEIDDLLDIINNSNFFYKYIEIINPINFKFIPEISRNKKLNWPFEIDYEDNPKLSGTNISIPKVLIKQRWFLEKKILICNINIFLKVLKLGTLELQFVLEERNVIILNLVAKWNYKSILVPNDLLQHIVNDTKIIISKILK